MNLDVMICGAGTFESLRDPTATTRAEQGEIAVLPRRDAQQQGESPDA